MHFFPIREGEESMTQELQKDELLLKHLSLIRSTILCSCLGCCQWNWQQYALQQFIPCTWKFSVAYFYLASLLSQKLPQLTPTPGLQKKLPSDQATGSLPQGIRKQQKSNKTPKFVLWLFFFFLKKVWETSWKLIMETERKADLTKNWSSLLHITV